jgi:integrase
MGSNLEKIQNAINARQSIRVRVARQDVSLYCGEKRGEPYWTLVWYEGDARRRKSFSQPDDAIATTRLVVESMSEGTLASSTLLNQPEDVAQIPIDELVNFYKLHHPNFREVFNSPTTREVADQLLDAAKKSGRSKRHLETIRGHLRKFCEKLPRKIRTISVEDVNNYLQNFQCRKTRLNHRITIIALFRFAQRRGILPEKETTAPERSDRPSVVAHEPDILAPEEMAILLNNCANRKLRAWLVFGGLCGLRSSEIERLCWEHVKDDHIILGAAITKTARRRVAEISGNAVAWLEDLRQDSGPVSYLSSKYLYTELHKLLRKLKMEWKSNALRHSFASYHLEFHRDPPRTSKTAGHSLRILETTYAKLVSREDAVAWFSVFPQPRMNQRHEPKTSRQNTSHHLGG